MTKDEKDQLTPEMIKGYHEMVKVRTHNGQEIINALGDVGVDVNIKRRSSTDTNSLR